MKRMSMRVVHIFNSLEPSGAETMLCAAAGCLKSMGVSVDVIATMNRMGSYANHMDAAGFRVFHLPHRFRRFIDIHYCITLYRHLRKHRYDAVQIHPEAWRLTNVIVARVAGAHEIVTTVHNVFVAKKARRIQRGLRFFLIRIFGAHVVACGQSVFKSECNYWYKPRLIWNWVDSQKFFLKDRVDVRRRMRADLGLSDRERAIICIGNCSTTKNHAFLLDVLLTLPENFVLIHVGEEDAEFSERKVAKEKLLYQRVKFLGRRTDIPALLASSDVYAMPSLHEGFSIACIEATLMGVPSVVADVPGLNDAADLLPLCEKVDLNVQKFAAGILSLANLSCEELRIRTLESKIAIDRVLNMRTNVASYVRLWRGSL